jgi:F0F1-type ATP synthase membrane subunit a
MNVIGTALPIGEHWIIGGKNSVLNLHLDTVLLSLLVSGILLVLGLLIRRTVTSGPPSRLQNAVESIMAFLNAIIEESLGANPGRIASIALTLSSISGSRTCWA